MDVWKIGMLRVVQIEEDCLGSCKGEFENPLEILSGPFDV